VRPILNIGPGADRRCEPGHTGAIRCANCCGVARFFAVRARWDVSRLLLRIRCVQGAPTTKTRRHGATTRPEQGAGDRGQGTGNRGQGAPPARPGEKPQITQMSADQRRRPTDDTDPPTRPTQTTETQKHRNTETQRRDGMHWRRRPTATAPLGRVETALSVGWPTRLADRRQRPVRACRELPRVSADRSEWQTDDRASCGCAVFHNVGTTSATAGRLFGSQHCDRGLPRGARRGEGASNLLRPHRSRGHQRAEGCAPTAQDDRSSQRSVGGSCI
jgi:hypothetical protein